MRQTLKDKIIAVCDRKTAQKSPGGGLSFMPSLQTGMMIQIS
jgi:hypothetical protein